MLYLFIYIKIFFLEIEHLQNTIKKFKKAKSAYLYFERFERMQLDCINQPIQRTNFDACTVSAFLLVPENETKIYVKHTLSLKNADISFIFMFEVDILSIRNKNQEVFNSICNCLLLSCSIEALDQYEYRAVHI